MPSRSRISRDLRPPEVAHRRSRSRTERARSSNARTRRSLATATDATAGRRGASAREGGDLADGDGHCGEVADVLERQGSHEPPEPPTDLLVRGEVSLDGFVDADALGVGERLLGELATRREEVVADGHQRPAVPARRRRDLPDARLEPVDVPGLPDEEE